MVWTMNSSRGRQRHALAIARVGFALLLVGTTLLGTAPVQATPAHQEGQTGTGAATPDETTMEKVCAFFEEDKEFVEGLKGTNDAIEFVRTAAEGLAEATTMIGTKVLSPTDAVSWILTRGVTNVEVVGTDPQDGVVHYQHRDQYQDEQYAYVAVRVYADFQYQDAFVGCLGALGVDIPKSGALKDVPVTLDMSSLQRHFWMTSDFGVHVAPAGAPGGAWEARTDDAGVAQFKLRVHEEPAPSGQGEVRQETVSFAVTANPYGLKNVLAAIFNLLDVGLVQATGSLTAEWHAGERQAGAWRGTVNVTTNASGSSAAGDSKTSSQRHQDVTFTLAPDGSATFTGSVAISSTTSGNACTVSNSLVGQGSGPASVSVVFAEGGGYTVSARPTASLPATFTVTGSGRCATSASSSKPWDPDNAEGRGATSAEVTSLAGSSTSSDGTTTTTWNFTRD